MSLHAPHERLLTLFRRHPIWIERGEVAVEGREPCAIRSRRARYQQVLEVFTHAGVEKVATTRQQLGSAVGEIEQVEEAGELHHAFVGDVKGEHALVVAGARSRK